MRKSTSLCATSAQCRSLGGRLFDTSLLLLDGMVFLLGSWRTEGGSLWQGSRQEYASCAVMGLPQGLAKLVICGKSKQDRGCRGKILRIYIVRNARQLERLGSGDNLHMCRATSGGILRSSFMTVAQLPLLPSWLLRQSQEQANKVNYGKRSQI